MEDQCNSNNAKTRIPRDIAMALATNCMDLNEWTECCGLVESVDEHNMMIIEKQDFGLRS